MNLLLIANPISGGDARPRIATAERWLRAGGARVEVRLTGQRGDARRLAAELHGDFDRVVVAGGDGTLNEVANALAGSATPVAFLPFGTVNVFALETGIPLELLPACGLALSGKPRRITLGSIDGESFLLMASAGWDAAAVAGLRPAVKRRFGRLAYGISAAEALLAGVPGPVRIRLADGTSHEGFGVVVSNARCYGGRYVVTPEARLDSPHLEVCLFKRGGRLALLGYALRLGRHQPLQPPAVSFYSVDMLQISGDHVPTQVDGDPWGKLPATITARPEALSVILP